MLTLCIPGTFCTNFDFSWICFSISILLSCPLLSSLFVFFLPSSSCSFSSSSTLPSYPAVGTAEPTHLDPSGRGEREGGGRERAVSNLVSTEGEKESSDHHHPPWTQSSSYLANAPLKPCNRIYIHTFVDLFSYGAMWRSGTFSMAPAVALPSTNIENYLSSLLLLPPLASRGDRCRLGREGEGERVCSVERKRERERSTDNETKREREVDGQIASLLLLSAHPPPSPTPRFIDFQRVKSKIRVLVY